MTEATNTTNSTGTPGSDGVPGVCDLDLFADAQLADPYPGYARLRRLGPAVWMTKHRVWALPRYGAVKTALSDPETFSSETGVALTDQVNSTSLAGTVLASDDPEHQRLRKPLSRQLRHQAVLALKERIDQRARRDHPTRPHTHPHNSPGRRLAHRRRTHPVRHSPAAHRPRAARPASPTVTPSTTRRAACWRGGVLASAVSAHQQMPPTPMSPLPATPCAR